MGRGGIILCCTTYIVYFTAEGLCLWDVKVSVLCCTMLYCTVLYCTVLYCTVLCCTVLCCAVLY